jgi:hypothetical protein
LAALHAQNTDTKILTGNTSVETTDTGSDGKVEIKPEGTTEATFDANGLSLKSGASVNEFSTDGTLAGDSDDAVPTEKAVKTYADTKAKNDLSDLAATAINTSLISDTNNTDDLGSDAKKWKDGYFAGIVTTSKLYQTNPVYVNARLNGTMTVNNTSWTKVTLSTEDADTNNNFDNVTNYRFTAPTSGYYDIDGMVGYGNPGGVHNCIEAALFINGAEYKRAIQDAPSVDVTPSVHGIVKLNANDYVELFAVSLLVNPTTIGHATAVSIQCRLTIMQIG